MASIWKGSFWKATAERVISSIAGGALSVIGADAFNIVDADWQSTVAVALGAGLVSLLKAIAAGAGSKDGSPSIGSVERLGAAHRPPEYR